MGMHEGAKAPSFLIRRTGFPGSIFMNAFAYQIVNVWNYEVHLHYLCKKDPIDFKKEQWNGNKGLQQIRLTFLDENVFGRQESQPAG